MPRKFRLKLDHPYAKAGTIVEEVFRFNGAVTVELVNEKIATRFDIPYSVESDWLEEVKEEEMFTKKQVQMMEDFIMKHRWSHNEDRCGWAISQSVLQDFLDAHTLKTEE